MDIFLETSKGFLAIELKSTLVWGRKYSKGLYRLRDEIGKGKVKCLGVFLGERQVRMDGIDIYPAMQFLKLLWKNEVIR